MKELTRRYEEIVEKHDLEEWDPKDLDVKELKKGLVSVQEASFCTGCLNGGGRTDCEMRSCASNKKIKNCRRCNELMTCKNSELLQKMRKGARQSDLLVRDKNVDRQKFIEKGTNELKKRFPSCILLCDKH